MMPTFPPTLEDFLAARAVVRKVTPASIEVRTVRRCWRRLIAPCYCLCPLGMILYANDNGPSSAIGYGSSAAYYDVHEDRITAFTIGVDESHKFIRPDGTEYPQDNPVNPDIMAGARLWYEIWNHEEKERADALANQVRP